MSKLWGVWRLPIVSPRRALCGLCSQTTLPLPTPERRPYHTPHPDEETPSPMARKKIAAIVTTYFDGSHADLLVSRFVTGFPTPSALVESQVDVVSMYMEQLHPQDIGVEFAREHGIELFPSIRSALTLKQPMRGPWPTAPGWEIGELAVDGVSSSPSTATTLPTSAGGSCTRAGTSSSRSAG